MVLRIKNKDAKELMDRLGQGNYFLADVRTEDEYYTGHAAGAVNFDVDSINSETAEDMIPDKKTPVFVYCKTGTRAAIASEILDRLGYEKIYDMGGLFDWPYPLVAD